MPISTGSRATTPGTFDNIFTLADIGASDTIDLRNVDAYHTIYFSLPQTQVIRSPLCTSATTSPPASSLR
jgi:cellulose synthase (UDP-forming)